MTSQRKPRIAHTSKSDPRVPRVRLRSLPPSRATPSTRHVVLRPCRSASGCASLSVTQVPTARAKMRSTASAHHSWTAVTSTASARRAPVERFSAATRTTVPALSANDRFPGECPGTEAPRVVRARSRQHRHSAIQCAPQASANRDRMDQSAHARQRSRRLEIAAATPCPSEVRHNIFRIGLSSFASFASAMAQNARIPATRQQSTRARRRTRPLTPVLATAALGP